MLEALSSPWIPWGVLVGLALIARQLRGNWLSPGAFVALVWAAYVGLCLLLTDYQEYPSGIWMIVLLVFGVQFGTVLSEGVGSEAKQETTNRGADQDYLEELNRRVLLPSILCALVALVGTGYLLFWSLERFDLPFSPLSLLSLGHLWSVARYEHGELEPWAVRLLIMWVYPAALLAGLAFATTSTARHKYLTFLPFVPALLIGTAFAARAGLAFSFVCWISGLIAVRYKQSRGSYLLFRTKFVVSLLALALVGLLFFIAIDGVRGFKAGERFEVTVNVSRLDKYFFGALPAFTYWFHTYSADTPTLGAYTFAGVFDRLGIKQREIGVYEEYLVLRGGEEINIYTAFRGLIQDFTPVGAVLLAIAMGVVVGATSRAGLKHHPISLLVLAGYYACIVFSPNTSLFTYNGLILAWGVAALRIRSRPRIFADGSHES